MFGSNILQSTFLELSRADAERRKRLLADIVTESLAFNGLFAIPGVLGGFIIGDRLLRIYGEEFTRGVFVLGVLILVMLIYDYQGQLWNALNAIDRPDLSFCVNAVFLVTNLFFNVGLVILIGWEGADVATVMAASVGLVMAFTYLHRLIDFDLPVGEFSRQIFVALIMLVAVGSVRLLLETTDLIDHNFVFLVLLVSLGASTYFPVLTALSERLRTTIADNSPIPVPFIH